MPPRSLEIHRSLCPFLFLKAVTAINWFVVGWLKWYFGNPSTLAALSCVYLSRWGVPPASSSLIMLFTCRAAFWTAFGVIGESFCLEETLLTCCENKFLFAVLTCQCSVFHIVPYPSSLLNGLHVLKLAWDGNHVSRRNYTDHS